jgi:hypothetical protein
LICTAKAADDQIGAAADPAEKRDDRPSDLDIRALSGVVIAIIASAPEQAHADCRHRRSNLSRRPGRWRNNADLHRNRGGRTGLLGPVGADFQAARHGEADKRGGLSSNGK